MNRSRIFLIFLILPFLVLAQEEDLTAGFGTIDTRYARDARPEGLTGTWEGIAWRGERVNLQVVIHSTGNLDTLGVTAASLRQRNGKQIDSTRIQIGAVGYVWTDEFADGCGQRQSVDYDSSLVADRITGLRVFSMTTNQVQPVWVSIDVPPDATAGLYEGELELVAGGQPLLSLPLRLEVLGVTLPAPENWSFHLDLWQNPYAVARYYQVPLWSEAHFGHLRPLLERLAQAGQKCITASIIDRPWNGQTYDPFEPMIRWIRQEDGAFTYDYSVFDQWVSFAMDCGLNDQINCYSMIPWGLNFRYYDVAGDSTAVLQAEPGSEAYEAHWLPMLQDFARHLKEKGWFERTTIAMDERPMEHMLAAMKVVRRADPGFKVSLAGTYHDELSRELYDYCIASAEAMPEKVKAWRTQHSWPMTYYTCCVEAYPNTFTFSPPAEATWIPWHAAARGLNGYLRWAYNSWVKDARTDSRFRSWPAGDTYLVYPDNETSIRFERLRDGIEDFEKIRLLRPLLTPARRQELDRLLQTFKIEALAETPAAEMVNHAQRLLNGWAKGALR